MGKVRLALLGALCIGAIPQIAISQTMTFINTKGECAVLEIEPTTPLCDIIDYAQSYCVEDPINSEGLALDRHRFDFEISHAGMTVRAKTTQRRNYDNPVTKQEKKELSYIVTSLASDSLISLGASKSSLKKAGDKIDHLHPYRFLMTVFTDEKLKAGVHAIRDRGGWVWDGFISGLTGSLKDEAAADNLHQFTDDFAKKINIEVAHIKPHLDKGKWEDFVNKLIDTVPREINPNRYDM